MPWGAAGEWITMEEFVTRRRARNGARRLAEHRQHADDQDAYQEWRLGMVVPRRITLLLDANEMYGPEVDQQLGGEEPMVDEWEAGVRYPTWVQVLALAELVGVTPRYLTRAATEAAMSFSSAMLHLPPGSDWRQQRVITGFTSAAIDAVVGGAPALMPEGAR